MIINGNRDRSLQGGNHVLYSGEISRGKFSRLTSFKTFRKLNFEDRLDYHCICIDNTIIRFSRINFQGSCEIHKTAKFIVLEKFLLCGISQHIMVSYHCSWVQYKCQLFLIWPILAEVNCCSVQLLAFVLYSAVMVANHQPILANAWFPNFSLQ